MSKQLLNKLIDKAVLTVSVSYFALSPLMAADDGGGGAGGGGGGSRDFSALFSSFMSLEETPANARKIAGDIKILFEKIDSEEKAKDLSAFINQFQAIGDRFSPTKHQIIDFIIKRILDINLAKKDVDRDFTISEVDEKFSKLLLVKVPPVFDLPLSPSERIAKSMPVTNLGFILWVSRVKGDDWQTQVIREFELLTQQPGFNVNKFLDEHRLFQGQPSEEANLLIMSLLTQYLIKKSQVIDDLCKRLSKEGPSFSELTDDESDKPANGGAGRPVDKASRVPPLLPKLDTPASSGARRESDWSARPNFSSIILYKSQRELFEAYLDYVIKLPPTTRNLKEQIHGAFDSMTRNAHYGLEEFDAFVIANKAKLSDQKSSILGQAITGSRRTTLSRGIISPARTIHRRPASFVDALRSDVKQVQFVDPKVKAAQEKLKKTKAMVDDIVSKIGSPEALVAHLDTVIMGQDHPKRMLALAVFDHYKKLQYNLLEEMRAKGIESVPAIRVQRGEVFASVVATLKESAGVVDSATDDAEIVIGGAAAAAAAAVSDPEVDIALRPKTLKKQNVLLVGPSGSGKTRMVQLISEKIGVPVYFADATQFTSEGYIGGKVSSVIPGVFAAAEGNVDLAELSMVFIDEIDKTKKEPSASGRDIIGRVQMELLKMVEGRVEEVGRGESVDTKNIMFIFAGAFAELTMPAAEIDPKYEEKLVEKLMQRHHIIRTLPYVEELKTELKPLNIDRDFVPKVSNITTKELHEFGMMPEFIGRIGAIINLDHLTVDILRKIVQFSGDSILVQQLRMFELAGLKLSVRNSGLDAIAELALLTGSGARGIEQVLSGLNGKRFDSTVTATKTLILDRKLVEGMNPTLIERKRKVAEDKARYKKLVDEVLERETEELADRRIIREMEEKKLKDFKAEQKMRKDHDEFYEKHVRGMMIS